MRKKLSMFLTLVMALTMMMGLSLTALAADNPPLPEDGSFNIPIYENGGGIVGYYKAEGTRSATSADGKTVKYTLCHCLFYNSIESKYYNPQYVLLCKGNDGLTYPPGEWDLGGDTEDQFVGAMSSVIGSVEKNELKSMVDNMMKSNFGVGGTILGWEDSDGPTKDSDSNASTPAHIHSFKWQTITEPTKDADGLEGEVCSCGAVRNTQPLSAYGYALNEYATPMINAAKTGQTITFEFGEWNSFPKSFMAKLAAKNDVTYVFHYKWNHVKQEITIPAGCAVDTAFDWYGPAKMEELYGAY